MSILLRQLGSYWLELFGCFGILWAAWRLWKGQLRSWWSGWKNQGQMEMIERLKSKIPPKGAAAHAPIVFAMCCAMVGGYLVNRVSREVVSLYECPDNCLGIVKIEGPNAMETVNLKTGRRQEWRFKASPPATPGALFSGYVVELTVIEHGGYETPDYNNHLFHIVRGKELGKPRYAIVESAVYPDPLGVDRPVLAKNCRNAPDDSDATPKPTICEGGDAQFATQLSSR